MIMEIREIIIKSLFFTCFAFGSCSSNFPQTTEQKISYYESRARTYQALADAQRLSPPYNSPTLRNRGGLHEPSMRMVYLSEAKKYKRLAEQAKEQFDTN